jgi:hypothetical protein
MHIFFNLRSFNEPRSLTLGTQSFPMNYALKIHRPQPDLKLRMLGLEKNTNLEISSILYMLIKYKTG